MQNEAANLEEAVSLHMPNIDYILHLAGMPIHKRTLNAAIKFVEIAVIEVSNDTKEDFLVKPWFAPIFHAAYDWYQDNYGAALESSKDDCITGVVVIRGVPVKVLIPKTRSMVEDEGSTSWCIFPTQVDEEENPELWLVNSPPIGRMQESQRETLKVELKELTRLLRTLRLYLITADTTNNEVSDLLSGVLTELRQAALGIVGNENANFGGVIWALQMAIERTLKALSLQKFSTFQETHDLFRLYDAVADFSAEVPRDLIKKIPSSREVIDGRYGLSGPYSLEFVVDAYIASLRIVRGFSKAFDRKMGFSSSTGFRFLIKRAPWISTQNP